MTSADPAWESASENTPAAPALTLWDRGEALLERASEWLNPILVKEARQALKSQQFAFTFGMLLLFGWIWTLVGVYFSLPGIFYGAAGKGMLYGYFLVLAVPLLVVVPFSAFRSLAAEREDGTFELISITALNARQIVGGKLGSAILQMLVYFSALAPCVAFTYLLRGVDIFSIFFVLYYSFMASLLLSTLALMVATATRARHWQVLLSVLLLLLLFIAAIGWVTFIWNSLNYNIWVADEWQFWAVQAFVFTIVASFFVLFLWAAGAQISFPSDNRSTRLRYVMLAQQLLWMGWTTYFWIEVKEPEMLAFAISVGVIYWMLVGAMMVGEYPQLSPRMKRELPQSVLGRMFLTWFNPGSGTGYIFATLNIATLVVFSSALLWTIGLINLSATPWTARNFDEVQRFAFMLGAYAVCYLGVSRLVVILARKMAAVGLVFSLLITIFFIIAGSVIPYVFQYWLFDYRLDDYTELQITNWFWTLIEATRNRLDSHPLVMFTVPAFALLIFLANLLLTAKEVAQVRIAAPQRVQEEDAALRPASPRKPSSPWDDDDMPPGS